MSFLIVTIPVSIFLAGCLLVLVLHAVRQGGFDDWEGPAVRMLNDDDSQPELDREVGEPTEMRQNSPDCPA